MAGIVAVLFSLAMLRVLWVVAVWLGYAWETALILGGTKLLRASWAFAVFCVLVMILVRPWPVGVVVWILFVPLFTPRARRHRG